MVEKNKRKEKEKNRKCTVFLMKKIIKIIREDEKNIIDGVSLCDSGVINS